VATPAHRTLIQARLETVGIDVQAAQAQGRYVALDAAETLSQFMLNGAPDADRFNDVIGGVISRTDQHGRDMRIFGEMVALLVAQNNPEAALQLEALWNQLQKRLPFSLLCGYRLEEMRGEALAGILVDACAEHSTVVPAESYSELDGSDARLRAIAELQQKAASLEREVAQRHRAEEQLQRALAAERAARDQAGAALRARDECDVDALRLEQVLTNLLDNAIKYSPDGGPVEVVLAQTSDATVELSVRDHGLGIPADKRGQIFERFYQAHQNGGGSGLGLGLYVSRRIVEQHGGEIRAEFPDDGGTRMCVQLPMAHSSVRASVAAD
jgi:signal transduction histidine kinase